MKKISKVALLSAGALGLAMAIGAGAADAGSKKKGPRAGLAVATECGLSYDDTVFDVTVKLEDNSSGSVVQPELMHWSIGAVAKGKGNWDNIVAFATKTNETEEGEPGVIPLPSTILSDIVVHFDLCTYLGALPAGAKAVNADTTITYDRVPGSGDMRTVVNRCFDNPDTEEWEGGQSIDFDDLVAACPG